MELFSIRIRRTFQLVSTVMREYNQNFTVMRVFDALLQGKIERGEIKL